MANKKDTPKPDFYEESLKLSFDFSRKKHELKMKELEFMRESDRLHHERELTRGRIKSAEIRRSQLRREVGPYKA